ncbi:hypothetical protein BJF78_33155 [Pseudonocardia sp. CNS-139]|nr:hypothetical protein BJF78_33155 [Pseudonocardia sp. CNS-139]
MKPSRRAASAAIRRLRRSAYCRVPSARRSGVIAASVARVLRRRCSGCGRPRAASAAAALSRPDRAHVIPVSQPARTAGSDVRRAVNAAARRLRVALPSSGWPRSRPNAARYPAWSQPWTRRCASTDRNQPPHRWHITRGPSATTVPIGA